MADERKRASTVRVADLVAERNANHRTDVQGLSRATPQPSTKAREKGGEETQPVSQGDAKEETEESGVSTAKLKNRITDEPIDATDPSTPDDLVNSRRLLGRLAYRRAPEKEPLGQHDTDFWLGWLDGRLAGLYERLKKQLGR